MKLPEFNHAKAEWDKYRAFYIGLDGSYRHNALFIQFDTGELICTRGAPEPDQRHVYKHLNLEIFGTQDDTSRVFKTPEGETIRPAWLDDRGHQILLLDHDTRQAVRLNYSYDIAMPPIPARFRGTAHAYFMGPDCPPIGRPVQVNRPAKLTPEQKEHLADLRAACKAWEAIHGEEAYSALTMSQRHDTRHGKPLQAAWLLQRSFTELTRMDRLRLLHRGTSGLRDIQLHPHLVF